MRFVFISESLPFIFAIQILTKMFAFFQELLALEERIGNVSTGLSEEAVIKLLKQRKFSSWRLKASFDHEPCCICQVSHIILSLSELLPSSVGHRYFSEKRQTARMTEVFAFSFVINYSDCSFSWVTQTTITVIEQKVKEQTICVVQNLVGYANRASKVNTALAGLDFH